MTTISNERKQFDVTNESDNLTLIGRTTYSGKGEVYGFNGNIYGKGSNEEESFSAWFNYSEKNGVVEAFTLCEAPINYSEEARTLITTTVNDIKEQLNAQDNEEN